VRDLLNPEVKDLELQYQALLVLRNVLVNVRTDVAVVKAVRTHVGLPFHDFAGLCVHWGPSSRRYVRGIS
jgi:hypothetical protein